MERAPLWARAAYRVNLNVRRVTVLLQVFIEELICARVPAAARPDLTNELFKRLAWYYAPGGEVHNQGMWEWELAAMAMMDVMPGDSILVGAAGGGREIDALTALGYSVRGFDPSTLVDARGDGQIVRATYDDLVHAITDREGPLVDIAHHHFDGVILGWGSMNHVLTDGDRHDLLQAIHDRWPAAGVMLSYQEDRLERTGENPQLARVRRRLRTLLRTDRHSPGVEFLVGGGFMYFPSHTAIAALAADTGYEVVHSGGPYPHDVLMPIGRAEDVQALGGTVISDARP